MFLKYTIFVSEIYEPPNPLQDPPGLPATILAERALTPKTAPSPPDHVPPSANETASYAPQETTYASQRPAALAHASPGSSYAPQYNQGGSYVPQYNYVSPGGVGKRGGQGVWAPPGNRVATPDPKP